MPQTLPSAIAWWARLRGDQPAVVLGGETLTYAEYKDWSDRVAAMLISNGMQPGDRVAICSANSLPYVALIMGIIRAGGIVNPVNFRYTPREITELCETTEPSFAFASPEYAEQMMAAEIERVVCEFPGVVEALAIAAPDNKFGETPFVVYHGPGEIDVAALIDYCNANLSNYKVPRYVAYSVDPLPRLATGKLSKPAVRQMYAGHHEHMARVR